MLNCSTTVVEQNNTSSQQLMCWLDCCIYTKNDFLHNRYTNYHKGGFYMKVDIGDSVITLNEKDVQIAKASVNSFLSVTKKGADAICSTSLYLTTIMVMFLKSKSLLEAVDPDTLEEIMSIINSND